MEYVAHRAVVQYHHFGQIWLDVAEVFNVGSVTKRTVLSVVPAREVLPFLFEPVNDRIGILLHRGSEYNQVIPFAHLPSTLAAW